MIARKYVYLIALAREQHFGRAAASCHISPSTLSAALRDLEAELGVTVVERGQRFAGLTQEGRCVVEYAQRMAADASGLKQRLAQLREGLSGRLRLGVIPTALTAVASLTAAFSRRHPLVTAEVLSLATQEILARLRNFELDAGIVYIDSGGAEDLTTTPIWRENHVLITGAGSIFAGRGSLSWKEAGRTPLCLLTSDMQNRKTIDRVFANIGCRPEPTLETNSIVSVLAHVCTGSWSSIVPKSVLDLIGTPRDIRVLELVEPEVAWSTGLVTLVREPRPPMVEALVKEALTLNDAFGKDEWACAIS